jgi:hypothetical protein
MTFVSRLCLFGLATVLACSYDASQLKGPAIGASDGSLGGIDGPPDDAGNDGQQKVDSGPIADLRSGTTAADAASDARTGADVSDNSDANTTGDLTDDARDIPGDPSTTDDAIVDNSTLGDIGFEAQPELRPESGPEPAAEPTPEPTPEPVRDGGVISTSSCINQIINNGYVYGSAPPCSACKDISTPLQTKCEGMLDCLAPPSTKTDLAYCQNKVGGSQRVYECVTALTNAACPSGF